MNKEYVNQQVRAGNAEASFATRLPSDRVRSVPTFDQPGRFVTLEDTFSIVTTIAKELRSICPHPHFLWTIAIARELVEGLILTLVRVEGPQADLLTRLAERTELEQLQGEGCAKAAAEIADLIDSDAPITIETVRDRIAQSPDPILVERMLLSMKPGHAEMFTSGGPLPPFQRPEMPRTLSSQSVHRLRVAVASVESGVAYVQIKSVVKSDSARLFDGLTGAVRLTFSSDVERDLLLVCQLRRVQAEVDVHGAFPLRARDSRLVALTLSEIVGPQGLHEALDLVMKQLSLPLDQPAC